MTANTVLQLMIYLVVLALLAKPLGAFMARVYEGERTFLSPIFGPVERQTKEPEEPTEFDYESEHFVLIIPEHYKPAGWTDMDQMPTTFELQVRTLFMHAWAEPQHDLGYKGTELDHNTKRELAWVAASAWGADRTFNDIARRLAAATGDDPAAKHA